MYNSNRANGLWLSLDERSLLLSVWHDSVPCVAVFVWDATTERICLRRHGRSALLLDLASVSSSQVQ